MTEKEYRAVMARIEELMDAAVGTPEGDELDSLATLAEEYEDGVPGEIENVPLYQVIRDAALREVLELIEREKYEITPMVSACDADSLKTKIEAMIDDASP